MLQCCADIENFRDAETLPGFMSSQDEIVDQLGRRVAREVYDRGHDWELYPVEISDFP
jgi:hypothetical protein